MVSRPSLVYAGADGKIYDWPGLEMMGRSGGRFSRVQQGEWIPLPPGSELFLLPGRLPLGYNPAAKRTEPLTRDPFNPSAPIKAVAAFMAPAHTQIYTAAYQTLPDAPILPLFAYTAVGWKDGRFVAAGIRVDPDERQDHRHFNRQEIARRARDRLKRSAHNRLIQHLGKCALSYGCPAANNYFMDRWEAPLPSSPACNARCLGCISLQEESGLCATQERIRFVPTPEELAEVAVPHLRNAPKAVVSFGQGCEGEPLLQAGVIEEAVRRIRAETLRGTVNLNTNGSLPERVKALCQVGLDSIRVSLNSARSACYQAYFRPRGYGFDDLCESLRIVKTHGGFASINYFVMPGFTDQDEEFAALCRLIDLTRLDLIQMRNLNIDPEWYFNRQGIPANGKTMGIRKLMNRLRDRFPDLRFGYFNPCLDEKARVVKEERSLHPKPGN
jgi:pyruvate-formate lyase-activating enzyme